MASAEERWSAPGNQADGGSPSYMTFHLTPDCQKNNGKPPCCIRWAQQPVCGLWVEAVVWVGGFAAHFGGERAIFIMHNCDIYNNVMSTQRCELVDRIDVD